MTTIFKMKRFRSLIVFCSIILPTLSSCSSPTSVAEKALKVVGRGTFVPTDVDRYVGIEPRAIILLTSDYGDIFDDALRKSQEAEDFRENGYYKESKRSAFFNFSDVLFEKFELISKEEITTDLYGINNYALMREGGIDERVIEQSREVNERFYKDYQENNDCGTWLIEKDVPMYILRYKLDNQYIANISVVKCPDAGFRVCAFRIE